MAAIPCDAAFRSIHGKRIIYLRDFQAQINVIGETDVHIPSVDLDRFYRYSAVSNIVRRVLSLDQTWVICLDRQLVSRLIDGLRLACASQRKNDQQENDRR